MAKCKSCENETGKEPNMSFHDGNEFYISYEYGIDDPRIDLNKTYFCGECLRTDKAMDWAWAEANWEYD